MPRDPGPGEVLCRTLEFGICGTDRDILESGQPLVPPGESFLALGHECLARVERCGAGVTEVAPGDLVVPAVRRPLDVQVARPDLLPFGQFTERGIVYEHGFSAPYWLDRPQYLFRVPPAITHIAVLTEPLSIAEKGINEALAVQRGRIGESVWTKYPPRVLVTGMGPIGFACVLACVCRHWNVMLYGRDREDSFRADLAHELGAHYVPAQYFECQPADVERDGFDLILECTGSDEVLLRVAPTLASCGVMVWLGSSRQPQARSHNLDVLVRHAVLRNHVHLGTVNAAPRDFRDALRHLEQLHESNPRQVAAIITDRVSPGDALWHYENRREQGIKTVVIP
ncbi:MAG: alcohol dehydrogenase catalytic domain-containing protein [Pirellulaceae bacterium]